MPTTTNLRKVGGSIMLAVPPAILEQLDLSVGSQVELSVDNGSLVIKPGEAKPSYTLEELLSKCDCAAEPCREDIEWIDGKPHGQELL